MSPEQVRLGVGLGKLVGQVRSFHIFLRVMSHGCRKEWLSIEEEQLDRLIDRFLLVGYFHSDDIMINNMTRVIAQ